MNLFSVTRNLYKEGFKDMQPTRVVDIQKLSESAVIPTYGSDGAACFDFYANISEKDGITIPAHSMKVIGTGVAVALPENTVLFMYSRSGHGFKHNLRFVNCVGVIDSDYRGEIMVGIYNDSDKSYTVQNGERVAQGIVQSYIPVSFNQVDKLSDTVRGTGGFGSTGK